jgi:hypothetical protein
MPIIRLTTTDFSAQPILQLQFENINFTSAI